MKREVFQQSSSLPVLNKCQDCQDFCLFISHHQRKFESNRVSTIFRSAVAMRLGRYVA